MIRFIFIGLALLMLHSAPPPCSVERLYWDHVEGFCLADSIGREIYAGSRERLYYSSDFGRTWTHLGDLPKMTLIRQIIPMGKGTIFINSSKGIYGEAFLSTDSGHSFCVCLPSTGAGNCAWFDSTSHTLYAAAEKPFKLMRSSDSGYSWVPDGSTLNNSIKDPHVCSLLVDSNVFYVSTSSPATIYRRSDQEQKWSKCFTDPEKDWNRELPLVTQWGHRLIACLSILDGPTDRIYLSDDDAKTWRSVRCPFGIWGAGISSSDPKTIWAGNFGTNYLSHDSASIQYTTNEGQSWIPVLNCKARIFWQLNVLPDSTLFAATDFGLLRIRRDLSRTEQFKTESGYGSRLENH